MSEKSRTFASKSKRMNGLTLWAFPKGYKINNEGKAPLFIRISLNSERAEIALKRFISPNLWDNKRQVVKGRNPESASINEQIRVFKVSLYNHYTQLLNEGQHPTAQKLKDAFQGFDKKGKSLIDTFLEHNLRMSKLVGKEYAAGTLTRYETCLNLLKEYLKSAHNESDILLKDIKLDFITGFDSFLRIVRGCNNNTTIKYVKNLRKVINMARAYEWMDHDPFINYKSKLESVDRERLTQEELDTMLNKHFDIERLEFIKDIFLFSCYTGLAYSDIKKLSKDNLYIGINGKQWIQINRTKTNVLSKIPVLPVAQAIIEKYQNNPECEKYGTLLPVPSNQKYNAYLKEIADCCGIKKTLTTHIGRHSFATTVTLNNKVPIETVAKMLGHKSVKTTEQYAKVLEVKINEDMSGLMEKYRPVVPLRKIANE